jgi:TolB-like protein/Flp pilus assembly protein TadD
MAADPDARARFEREAKAVAAISHPNILAIHDIGVEHGIPFSVTELLEGETLRACLARGPLPWRRAVEIALAVAEGLAAAHAKGVIHRDLKPENIFLTENGRTKILDFGLARWSPPVAEDPSSTSVPTQEYATRPGMIMGTVGYMSPEQVRGASLDARSDIFSLGVVLYEMLTNHRPFAGESVPETIASILKEDPAPLVKLGVAAPAALERVVSRCMEKKPEDRFAAARDLQLALEEMLARRPSRLTPPRAALAAGVLLAIALVGWGIDRWGNLGSSARIDSLAVLPLENLSGDPEQEYFADGMTDALIGGLAKIGALRVTSRTSAMQYKGIRKPLPEIARELKVDAVLEGTLARSGNRVRITAQLIDATTDRHLWADSYERDLKDVLALQSDVAQAIAREIRIALAPADEKRLRASARPVSPEAFESCLKGRYAFWRVNAESLRKSKDYYLQAIAVDPNYALAYAGLADTYVTLGVFNFMPPTVAYPRARESALKALELDPELSEAYNSLAMIRRDYDWDWRESEKLFQRAIALNPQNVYAHHMYGIYHAWLGRFPEAMAEIQQARELDPLNLAVSSDAAYVEALAGRPERAIEQYLKTLELDPTYVVSHRELSVVYEQQGRFVEAIRHLTRAIELSPSETVSRAYLARVYALSGRPQEARRILQELQRESSARYVAAYDIALIYLGLGEPEEAFNWLEKGFQSRDTGLLALKVDLRLRSIRSDPRYQDLLRRVGQSQVDLTSPGR